MKCKNGFTLIELLVSLGILAILAGFSSWAYLNSQKNTSLSTQTNQLVSSLRQVQAMAVSGQTQDQENGLDMGIHFESDRYIIFYGAIYNLNDDRNIETILPSGTTLILDLPASDLVFQKRTGEVQGYDSIHHIITINQSESGSRILQINKLGVVDIE